MTSVHRHQEFLAEQGIGRIEVVAYRDPEESGTDGVGVDVFIDGQPVEVRLFVVDPGAGYSRSDWNKFRDSDLADASPAARAVLTEHYEIGAETEFITDEPDPKPEPAAVGGLTVADFVDMVAPTVGDRCAHRDDDDHRCIQLADHICDDNHARCVGHCTCGNTP